MTSVMTADLLLWQQVAGVLYIRDAVSQEIIAVGGVKDSADEVLIEK